jgi:hypothetical protein
MDVVCDAAVFNDQDPIGQRNGFGDVMGDEDRRKSLIVPDSFQQPLHGNPRQGVERAEWLVERQHAGIADQGARQRHALLLSAGEHRRPLPALVVEADFAQRLFGAQLCIRGCTVAAKAYLDVRQHPRPWQ